VLDSYEEFQRTRPLRPLRGLVRARQDLHAHCLSMLPLKADEQGL